jgi:hypothetical protein
LMSPLTTEGTITALNATVAGYRGINNEYMDFVSLDWEPCIAINGSVDNSAYLPNTAPLMEIVEVRPSAAQDNSSSYYLRAESDTIEFTGYPSPLTPGVIWRETAAPGEFYLVNPTTMPQVIVEDAGIFTLRPGLWTERKAGNETNNPLMFEKYPVQDVATYQNRLAFAIGPQIVTSVTNDLFNFFRQTMTAVLATDPIAIASAVNQETPFDYLVGHGGSLVAFNSNGQYKMTAAQALTTENAALPKTSGFPYNSLCKPLSTGTSLYFPNTDGATSGLNVLSIDASRDSFETASPITGMIPRYIKGAILKQTAEPMYGFHCVTVSANNHLYVNDYFRSGNQFQNSWGTWKLAVDDIKPVSPISRIAVIATLSEYNGLACMLHVPLRPNDAEASGKVHLDFQLEYTNVGNTITLPDNYPLGTFMVVEGLDSPHPGALLDYTIDGNLVTLDEGMAGGNVYVGSTFESVYQPSQLRIRDASGFVQHNANLNIVRWVATLENTGILHSQVISQYYDFPPFEYYGMLGNDVLSKLDDPNINTQELRIPYKQPHDLAHLKMYSSDWTPATIVGLEWVGGYSKRGRRF